MNLRSVVCTMVGVFLLIMSGGCEKPVPPAISKALDSTNGVFQPNLQEPIPLSARQIERLKRIIARFNDPSQVRIEKDALLKSGWFVLGDVHFGWVGSLLWVYDAEANRYFVVEDAFLAQMSKAFFRAEGLRPPLQGLSPEQWKEILSPLEGDN